MALTAIQRHRNLELEIRPHPQTYFSSSLETLTYRERNDIENRATKHYFGQSAEGTLEGIVEHNLSSPFYPSIEMPNSYPDILIRQMDLSEATGQKEMVDAAREIVTTHSLYFCHVPAFEILGTLVPGRVVLVLEEKVTALAASVIEAEQCEIEFDQFAANTELKERWRAIFYQAVHFITKTGYLYADWRNVIPLRAYESAEVSALAFTFQKNPHTGTFGVKRMLSTMVPPSLTRSVGSAAQQQNLSLSFGEIDQFKSMRYEELKRNSSIRHWHKLWGITSINDLFSLPDSAALFGCESLHYLILTELANHLTNLRLHPAPNTLINHRTYSCNPFLPISSNPFPIIPTQIEFEATLSALSSMEYIHSFEATYYDQPEYTFYRIFF